MREIYEQQVALLTKVLPVFRNDSFALKGGTAINFFYRDAPRLSVDIDLIYVPLEDRATTYSQINNFLVEVREKLETLGYQVGPSRTSRNKENKLVVANAEVQIKVEPNFIVRGVAFGVEKRPICKKVSAEVFTFPCASFSDVFGGKICAALERQHPRDLYDIKLLLENEGIGEKLKDAFLFYLISSKRPYHEILDSRVKMIDDVFKKHFAGMVVAPVTVDDLNTALRELKRSLRQAMSDRDRDLLISTLEARPRWELSGIPHLGSYPSVKWRMLNIGKMRNEKRQREIDLLSEWFER